MSNGNDVTTGEILEFLRDHMVMRKDFDVRTAQLDGRINQLDGRIMHLEEKMENRFDSVEARLGKMQGELEDIQQQLVRLEQRTGEPISKIPFGAISVSFGCKTFRARRNNAIIPPRSSRFSLKRSSKLP